MHLLVLSAFRLDSVSMFVWIDRFVSMHLLVLSAFRHRTIRWRSRRSFGLNAPSGAQCFPTRFLRRRTCRAFRSQCTFWCSVLSDLEGRPWRRSNAHVSMHLLVLSAFRLGDKWKTMGMARVLSQCTFWCSVLSDSILSSIGCSRNTVSMHLLVLSAFRLHFHMRHAPAVDGRLNAPSGAQCFPTVVKTCDNVDQVMSQCTFWCSVLSDPMLGLAFR